MLKEENPHPTEQIKKILSEAIKLQDFDEAMQRVSKIDKEWKQSNEIIHNSRRRVSNHAYLKHFYKSDMRFTREFEQVYYTFKDFGYEDNTKMVAEVYNLLRSYHRTLNAPDGFDYYKLIVGAMQGKMSFVNGEPRPAK